MVNNEDNPERNIRPVISFAFSETGHSHITKDRPCQDSSLCVEKQCGGRKYTFICVADGHGGDDYIRSGTGSALCCRAACDCMTDETLLGELTNVSTARREEELIHQLKKAMIYRWNELVAEHIGVYPFTEEELEPLSEKVAEHYRSGEYIERAYGTTLAAAVYSDEMCLIIQLGDGCSVIRSEQAEKASYADEACDEGDIFEPDDIFDDGEEYGESDEPAYAGPYRCPLPEDEKCVMNQTTSMCDSRALFEMRHYFINSRRGCLPDEIFLCTDGICNSFAANSHLFDFYSMISENLRGASDSAARDDAVGELWEFITRLSAKGSGDDVSLAAIIRADAEN